LRQQSIKSSRDKAILPPLPFAVSVICAVFGSANNAGFAQVAASIGSADFG